MLLEDRAILDYAKSENARRSVREEFADHEAHDEGDEEAACAGEGKAKKRLYH